MKAQLSPSDSAHILIACGGTGGHLFPGIAVAQCLQQQGYKVTLLISEKQVDSVASRNYPDLTFKTVPAVAMPKVVSLKIFDFAWNLWKTIGLCKKLIHEIKPRAVLGMGGFTSFPPIFAASRMGVKTLIHDSNALPGKANRLTARWCSSVLLGVKEAAAYFSNDSIVVTGTPLRAEMKLVKDKESAMNYFGLSLRKKVVLVMGGSQGAKNLNTMVLEAAESCAEFQFLMITGQADFDRIKELAGEVKNVHLIPFCSEMALAYTCADFVIARSGAASLMEIAYFGIPSLLVPFPFAADDHQAMNAQVYVADGAGIMVRQESLTADKIGQILHDVLEDEEKLVAMRKAAKEASLDDAEQRIAAAVLD